MTVKLQLLSFPTEATGSLQFSPLCPMQTTSGLSISSHTIFIKNLIVTGAGAAGENLHLSLGWFGVFFWGGGNNQAT